MDIKLTIRPKSILEQEITTLVSKQQPDHLMYTKKVLLISQNIEIGYGTIYKISPIGEFEEDIIKAISEINNNSPALLAAIYKAIAANRAELTVEVPKNWSQENIFEPTGSSHTHLKKVSSLIAWLTH